MKFRDVHIRIRSPGAALLHDLLMVPPAWMLAYWFRFNLGAVPLEYLERGAWALLVVVPVQGLVFWSFGLYRGVWRFASLPDVVRILKAVATGALLSTMALFVLTRLEGVPRSVPVLYAVFLVALVSGPRFIYRWLKDHRIPIHPGQRVLIAGAGSAGEMLVRDLLRHPEHAYQPVAFVDDAPAKQGKELHGIRVAGPSGDVPRLVRELEIDLVMLAIPSATSGQTRRIVELCEQAGTPMRTVPKLDDLMSGAVGMTELREVSIEDLLGRDPVKLDWEEIRRGLTDRTILVTGAGGSIGAELCRQLLRVKPRRLVLYENSEFNLYAIEMELRRDFSGADLVCRLGDVRDAAAVDRLFAAFEPDVVFHAAAYKHVPIMEDHVREAVQNNILGTRTVADAAHRHGCSEFVLISTDKAVNPTNVMGTSKRVAEIYCQNLDARSRTRFITVRFGNVLDSAGSVVPLFRAQIEAGGPVTVTHPDIERYFMTIPEACQLIMQASVLGAGGEIFVLDMGEPVRIQYLAEQMIRLSGKVPGEDVEIRFTRLRPGEKLFEELFHESERLQATGHDKILLAGHREVDWDGLVEAFGELQVACERFDEGRLMDLLTALVPENRIEGSADSVASG